MSGANGKRPVYVAGPGKRSNAELREVLSKWDKGGLAPLTIKQQVCGCALFFLHRFAGGGGGGEVEMRCTGDVAQASRTHLTGSLNVRAFATLVVYKFMPTMSGNIEAGLEVVR